MRTKEKERVKAENFPVKESNQKLFEMVPPPQEKAVKKIKHFFVKKTVLFELASSQFLEKMFDFQAFSVSAALF
jgi:hypothetical protein